MEKYMLVITYNRETEVRFFDSEDEAFEELERDYNSMLSEYDPNFKEEVKKIPGGDFHFGIDGDVAWITDNVNDNYCDWSIYKITI